LPVEEVGGANWQERVLEAEGPVLVEFARDTCSVCMAMQPVVERLAAEFGNWVPVLRADVDVEEDLVWAYGVMSTPTFMIFREGEPWHTLAGEVDYVLLKERLDDAMAGKD
jgi:thioredoxin 1